MRVARGYDRAGAVLALLLTGAAWWVSARFPADARVFPRMVLVMLGVLSVLWLVRTFLPARFGGTAPDGEPAPFFEHAGYFLAAVATIAGYIHLVGLVGYFTATVAFLPFMAIVLGYRRPIGLALTTLAFAGGVWLVFVVAFGRRLPAGQFPLWSLGS